MVLNQREAMQQKVLFRLLKVKNAKLGEICKKMKENISNVTLLTAVQLCELWEEIKKIVINAYEVFKIQPKNKLNKEYDSLIKCIRQILNLAIKTISSSKFIPTTILEVLLILHSNILPRIQNEQGKSEISSLLETWWCTGLVWKEKLIENVLKYLIYRSGSSLRHVKRLCKIKTAILLLKNEEDIQSLHMLVHKKTILSMTEGKEILCYLFSLGDKWTTGMHNNIKISLETAESNIVIIYANLYASAWLLATEKDKKAITEECLRNIIFHCFRTNRDSSGRGKLGENLLIFIDSLHNHSNSAIRKLLSSEIQTLLWKHLKAPGSYVRCNAAEILFTIYPIEYKISLRKTKTSYLKKQYTAIVDLLNDSDCEVNLIAINGIFKILDKFWNTVPNIIVKNWFDIMLEQTRSSAYSKIRLNIFFGFKRIMYHQSFHTNAGKMLEKFKNSLYDPDETVANAFVSILIILHKEHQFLFWNIISISEVFERLDVAEDNSLIENLTKLLKLRFFPNENNSNNPADLIKYGLSNASNIRKLFYYCEKEIDSNVVSTTIKTIILLLKENMNNWENPKLLDTFSTKCNISDNEMDLYINGQIDNNLKIYNLKDVHNLQNLLDILIMAFAIMNDKKSEQYINNSDKLITEISDMLPKLVQKFKNTSLITSTIFLFSFIPVEYTSETESYSDIFTNLLSNPDTTESTIFSIMHVLVKWNKSCIIFNLIIDNFNNTLHFIDIQNKATSIDVDDTKKLQKTLKLGLRLLKQLLRNSFGAELTDKQNTYMIKLLNKMHVLRTCIENKLNNERDSVLMTQIPDETLIQLFEKYILITLLIYKTDCSVMLNNFSNLIQWIKRHVLQFLPQNINNCANEFSVKIVHIMFSTMNSMIERFITSPKLCCDIVLLYCNCLNESSGIMFINEALNTIICLLNFDRVLLEYKDSILLYFVIPKLLMAVMITLTKFPVDAIKQYTDDLKALPLVINKCFLQMNEPLKHYNLRESYMAILLNTTIVCISKDLCLEHEKFSDIKKILDYNFPYTAEKIIRIIVHVKKYKEICLNVISKVITDYTSINKLSALILMYKIILSPTKALVKNVHALIKDINIQGPSQTALDRFIVDSVRYLINKILK